MNEHKLFLAFNFSAVRATNPELRQKQFEDEFRRWLAAYGKLLAAPGASSGIILVSPSGYFFFLTINDAGELLTARVTTSGTAQLLYFESPDTTLWQLKVNDYGEILTDVVVAVTATPLALVSAAGISYIVTINNFGEILTTKA